MVSESNHLSVLVNLARAGQSTNGCYLRWNHKVTGAVGRQFALEVCEHDKWIALPPVHDSNRLAIPVCDASYLDVYTVHTGR